MKFRFVISILLFFLCASLYSQSQNDDSQKKEYRSHPLYNNFDLSVGYNLDPKFTSNYFQGKIIVDLTEGWIKRFGFSSAIGGEIGLKQSDSYSSSFITTIYAPGLGFSFCIFPKLITSVGVFFTQTWYQTKEINENNTVNSLVYSNGLAVPVKIRFYFTDIIAISASINCMFHPWLPIQNENGKNTKVYDFVTQANIGITISIPSKQF